MKVVICENEKRCSELIEKWIKEYSIKESIHIMVDIFYSAERLIEKMEEGYYFDMIFLNTVLPNKNGIELGKRINERYGERTVSIIFFSSGKEHCVDLFELEPQNFHVKPLQKEMVQRDLYKYVKKSKNNKAVLKYREGGITKGIYLGDIIYIEAKRNGVTVYTTEEGAIGLKESITNIEKKYKENYFIRCHKSFVVNAKYIKKITNQKINVLNNYEIAIGRKYLESVKKLLKRYETEKFY